ncbi:MAG: NUDIX hydrolase [Omnitrophica bacterium]|nr:NUDIX hydrolase [Candidatus Omnitrophota bacterium]
MKNIKIKKIFAGKLLELYLEKKRFPNGYIADLEVIKHPGAVLIVPFLNKNKIVLIKQYRPVINSYIWELPAGTLNKGESPLSCAKRELVEEVGYKAAKWSKIGYIYPAPGYTTEKIIIFEAYGLSAVKADRKDDEDIVPAIFDKKGVMRLLKSGKLVDSKTIAALKLAGAV